MLNDAQPYSQVRAPRSIVKVNGVEAWGLKSWEVCNNSHYQADTFDVTLALNADPEHFGLAYWAQQTDIELEIFAGFPDDKDNFAAGELDSLILGKVDEIEPDLIRGEIHLHGRDLSGQMIDAQTYEKFQNLTSSQIVTKIAQRHGLTPVVTATKTKAGRYYQIDHARLTDKQTEWDLLSYLAQEEGFQVYVKGRELHFEPQVSTTSEPYVLQWQSDTNAGNFCDLKFTRSLTLAKGVVVNVRSWNSKQKKGFTVSYPRKVSVVSAHNAKAPQQYSFTRAGLTQQQALQLAESLQQDISRHEIKLEANLPADNLLTCQNIIRVTGTGSAFDQIYYPASINRRFGWDEGYTMTVHAKNHSTESQSAP